MSDAFYNALCDHQHFEGYEEGYKDGYEAGKRDAASPWHRVDEKPRDGQECIVAYLGPLCWLYEYATYHSNLNEALEEDIFIEGTDGFITDGDIGYARHGLFKYWMPLPEPPKEDA